MNILYSNLPILTIFFPFILALVLSLLVKGNWETEKQRKMVTRLIFMGMIMMSFFLGSMLVSVLQGEIIETVFWPQMIPFELSFRVDGFSISMAILSFILWSATFVYSISYIKKNVLRYYVVLLLALGAVQDTFFAIDLVNFYLFLEMTTIFAYFLIVHNMDEMAIKAGYKYLLMSITGAFLILLSILFAYRYTGNYELTSIIICNYPIVPILFLIGCFIKAGAVPLHTWLPDAHPAAPSPISAFLSGIMIKIGIYGIIRVIYPFISLNLFVDNIRNLLSVSIVTVGLISIFIGGFLALIQIDAKRLLAYSSISQIGYILFGIGLGTRMGLAGGFFHIINHAIFKGLLFLGIGAVIYRIGSKKLINFGSLWRKMPITTIACLIAAFSISGIPPFNGSVTKILLSKAVDEFSIIFKYSLTLASALTFAYIFKLMKFSFFGKEKKYSSSVKEVPIFMLMPMILLSCLCIFLSLKANWVVNELLPFAINENFHYHARLTILFWTKGIWLDTILTILLGWIFYLFTSRIGLMREEDKIITPYQSLAKRISFLSVDSLYCFLAIIVQSFCQRVNKNYSRDLNMHLSWIPLTLVILYFILV